MRYSCVVCYAQYANSKVRIDEYPLKCLVRQSTKIDLIVLDIEDCPD